MHQPVNVTRTYRHENHREFFSGFHKGISMTALRPRRITASEEKTGETLMLEITQKELGKAQVSLDERLTMLMFCSR